MQTLVIGGTGPTGPFLVNGLRARGHEVAILHTGRHEVEEIPPEVEHIHTDPFDEDAFRAALGTREFDVCIATYGRLRKIAEIMRGRCGRFLSVGGGPSYRGYMNAELWRPAGLPVPTREDAPRVVEKEEDEKGFRIARTEDAVFEHHPEATHFRYPYVYGPYQPMPREWCIVRRVLDRRPFLVLPDGGLTLCHFGYAENLAHAVLLAIEQPEASKGQVYNAGDAEVLSLRQVVEVVSEALDYRWDLISMPWALATPAHPMVMQNLPTHRVFDVSKLQRELGYRDVTPPREALARTARWLVDHPPAPGGWEEIALTDPFDYAAEDALVAGWRKAMASLPEVAWATAPGFTLGYSGPGGRPRSTTWE